MIVKRFAHFGLLLAILALPALLAAQEGPAPNQTDARLIAGIEEKIRQLDGKKKEIETLQEKVALQHTVLNSKALVNMLLKTDNLRMEFTHAVEEVEREVGTIESRITNPSNTLKQEGLADIRRGLDALKKEFAGIRESADRDAFGVLKLPDGRTLFRNGPRYTS